jgi:hypothetical protein
MTVLLPELDALVRTGGPCEGAVVVHQEDNAGPHIDKTYKTWLQEKFDIRGWKLEHEAPQGPYTNVLDLQMFPATSKRHSEVLQMYSNNQQRSERGEDLESCLPSVEELFVFNGLQSLHSCLSYYADNN